MHCSLIIRTYNEARYLPELLQSIRQQTVSAEECEVILVDSGSSDGTIAIAEQHGCRILRIDQAEFSFGRSLNIGCAAARGKHLAFISGHCVPTDQHWLQRLTAPLQSGEAALCYGRQEGGPETKFSEHMLFAKYFPREDLPRPSDFFCNNANAATRHEVWARLRFDETLTGLEDMHFGKRVLAEGGRVRYVREASVHHYHHELWRNVKNRYEREAIALQKIMPEIQVSTLDAFRYFAAGVFGDWSRALSQRQFLQYATEIVAFRFCQYYGTWRGHHIHRELSRQSKEKYFYPR